MKLVSLSKCKSAICMNLSDTSWSSGNAFVTGEGGLKFNSLTGQIGHSAAYGSPPCDIFLKGQRDGPANTSHAWVQCSSEYNEKFWFVIKSNSNSAQCTVSMIFSSSVFTLKNDVNLKDF